MPRIEKTVFISYRRTNFPWARAIYENLNGHGFDIFFDFNGIASGDFEQVILENIRARAHFLVLLTPSALERCGDPADWLRREIETALDTQRNIVPLMLEGFDFDTPAIATQLTGKLAALRRYNALPIVPHFFDAAMDRLRERHLNVPLEAVLHPPSPSAQRAASEQKAAADAAPAVRAYDLTAQALVERTLSHGAGTGSYPEFLDLMVLGNEQLALVAEPESTEFLLDPDGMRFRARRVLLVRYSNGVEQARHLVARVFLPPSRHGILQVENTIRVFIACKVTSGVYTMCGTVYEHDLTTLRPLRSHPLFVGQNWGWFATFDGPDVVHFSYAGYLWVRNTSPTGPISPSAAEAAHIRAVLQHSGGVLQLRGKGAPDEEQSQADEPTARWLRNNSK